MTPMVKTLAPEFAVRMLRCAIRSPDPGPGKAGQAGKQAESTRFRISFDGMGSAMSAMRGVVGSAA